MAETKFTGNVGKDAELRFTPGGRAVLNFNVCDSKSRKLENGEWETIAEQWFTCAVWGDLAEFYTDKILKGSRVTIYGEFYARKYQNKEGAEGHSLDVNVKGIDIFPAKNGQRSQGTQAATDTWGNQGGQDAGGWGNGPDSEPPF